ncbi:hypothetical protein J2X97_000785 [Epilithonimonas hungarica]|nr:hypothetical protein [Epilithonimonas hungarica]
MVLSYFKIYSIFPSNFASKKFVYNYSDNNHSRIINCLVHQIDSYNNRLIEKVLYIETIKYYLLVKTMGTNIRERKMIDKILEQKYS